MPKLLAAELGLVVDARVATRTRWQAIGWDNSSTRMNQAYLDVLQSCIRAEPDWGLLARGAFGCHSYCALKHGPRSRLQTPGLQTI